MYYILHKAIGMLYCKSTMSQEIVYNFDNVSLGMMILTPMYLRASTSGMHVSRALDLCHTYIPHAFVSKVPSVLLR